MSALPNIIGLDVSKTRTGVCWGRVGETPRFLSIKGSEMDDAVAAFKLFRWLSEFTKAETVDAVFIEAQIPHIPSEYDREKDRVIAKGSPHVAITLGKMIGAAEIVCQGRSIMCRTPAISTVRKATLGKGNLKSKVAKAAASGMCAALGWTPGNHDEADAAMVWLYGCIQIKPHAPHVFTPMMQAKVVSLAGGA